MFQRNFFGKTIFSGRPEKENMVFRAVDVVDFDLVLRFHPLLKNTNFLQAALDR